MAVFVGELARCLMRDAETWSMCACNGPRSASSSRFHRSSSVVACIRVGWTACEAKGARAARSLAFVHVVSGEMGKGGVVSRLRSMGLRRDAHPQLLRLDALAISVELEPSSMFRRER